MATLREDVESLLNARSAESISNTPDFILASFLMACLAAFDGAVVARDKWYLNGEQLTPAQMPLERKEWLRKTGLIPEPDSG
jgi:hypothetical protein